MHRGKSLKTLLPIRSADDLVTGILERKTQHGLEAQVVVDKLRPVSFGGSGWPVMMSEPQQTCRLGLHFCAMTVGVGIMTSSQSVAAQPALV